jgi:hypothetical protein
VTATVGDPDRLFAGADGTIWAAAPGGLIRFRDADVSGVWNTIKRATAVTGATAPDSAYAAAGDTLWRITGDQTIAIRPVATRPGCLAIDEVDQLALIARPDDTGIDAVPLAAGGEPRRIALPGPAAALCLSPDRRRLYVAVGSDLIAIDSGGGSAIVASMAGARLTGVAITAAGLVATCATGVLYGINPRHRSSVAIWRDPSRRPTAVAADKRGRRYLVATSTGPIAVAGDGSRAEPLLLRYPSPA